MVASGSLLNFLINGIPLMVCGLILIPFNKVVLTGTYGISEEGRRTLIKAALLF